MVEIRRNYNKSPREGGTNDRPESEGEQLQLVYHPRRVLVPIWLSRASAAEVARKEWQIAFFVVSIGGSTFSMVPAGRVLCGWYRCNGGSEKNQEINSKFALHLLHWMQKGICFLLHNVGCWGRESRLRPLLHRHEWLRWTRLRFSPILCAREHWQGCLLTHHI